MIKISNYDSPKGRTPWAVKTKRLRMLERLNVEQFKYIYLPAARGSRAYTYWNLTQLYKIKNPYQAAAFIENHQEI